MLGHSTAHYPEADTILCTDQDRREAAALTLALALYPASFVADCVLPRSGVEEFACRARLCRVRMPCFLHGLRHLSVGNVMFGLTLEHMRSVVASVVAAMKDALICPCRAVEDAAARQMQEQHEEAKVAQRCSDKLAAIIGLLSGS